jgi:hypothetical protein
MKLAALALTLSLAAFAQEPAPPANPTKPAEPAKPGDPAKARAPEVYTNPRSAPNDPRIGLKPGLHDAAEAAFGLVRLATLPKPPGFAPGALPPPAEPGAPPRPGKRPLQQYGATNSDLAFSGNHLFVGNYNGINFYDIDNPSEVKLLTSLLCPGGQGDVSVYGHLLFMSAEAMNGRLDCGSQGLPVPAGYKPPAGPPPPCIL